MDKKHYLCVTEAIRVMQTGNAKMNQQPKLSIVYDRKNKADAKHSGAIEIRIGYARKAMYVSTGKSILPSQWDKRNNVCIKRLDADVVNAAVKSALSAVQTAVESVTASGDFSLDLLRTALSSGRSASNPLDWMGQMIERRPLTESTRRQHRSKLRFLRSLDIFHSWADMTLENIERYDEAVRARVDAPSTVALYHKVLKAYLAEAVRHGLLQGSPYRHFRIKRPDDSATIRYLTEGERGALESLKLDGALARVRDLFIFCSYTGLAYSDMAKLSPDDIVVENGKHMIVDRRTKTATPYKIVLLPQALAILQRYGGVLPSITNQKCNYFLKMIAEAAGIKKRLTMHMARHTFATWALSRGVSIEVVSKMLAHSDISTTQLYAKVMQREVEKGYELLM